MIETIIFPLERNVEDFVPLANLSRGKQHPDTKLKTLSEISLGCLIIKDVKVIPTAFFNKWWAGTSDNEETCSCQSSECFCTTLITAGRFQGRFGNPATQI